MKRIGAIAVVAGILVTLVFFAHARPTTTPGATLLPARTAASGDCPQCVQLSQQVEALRRGLAAAEAQLAARSSQPTSPSGRPPDLPGPSTSAESPDAAADMKAARAAEEDRRHAHMAGVAQSFENERTNAGWATPVAARIDTSIGGAEALKGVAHNVECREKTCRLQIEDDGSGKLNQSLPVIASDLADVLPEISAERIDQGNGRGTMVLYMSSQRSQSAAAK